MGTASLTPMQKAYLLGKSGMFPLSQSSMHDFREFHGNIGTQQFSHTLAGLVEKYAALRTRIDEQQLVQQVLDQLDLADQLQVVDLTNLSVQAAHQQVQCLREKYRHYRHTLEVPPWQICLVQLPEQTEYHSVVFSSFDGLILDGYSISVLLEELFQLDVEKVRVEPERTQSSTGGYFQAAEKDIQFWQTRLASIESVTQLPWCTALEKITAPHYQRQSLLIPQAQLHQISLLAAKQKLLPNCLLTTIILDVLSRWTPDQKLLISMPISGSSMTGAVGNNSSFIVLDYQPDAKESFIDTVQNTQKNILQAMEHSSFSGIEISRFLMKQVQESIVLPVTLTNGLSWKKPPKHSYIKYVEGLTQTPQLALDIRLSLSVDADLIIDLDYAIEALPDTMIKALLQALQHSLFEISHLDSLVQFNPHSSIVSEIANTDEFPDTFQSVKVDDFLSHIRTNLFENIPNKTALVFDGQAISYKTLAENVAKVRIALNQAGIVENQVAAICLRKSPEHIYAILACALSGVIWLPVDMDSPHARQQFILKNSCADIAISIAAVPELRNLNIEQALSLPADAILQHDLIWQHRHDASPAYYLYTSGSTGTPKCVVLNNRATANVMQETIAFWKITQHDIHFAATPFHHDMSIFDIMAPLSVGGTLVIPTYEQAKNAAVWAQLIETYQVSIWCTVPAMADMLLTAAKASQLQSIRLINQGGDYVKPSVVKKLQEILPNTRLISIGGPTETTIWSIWHEITDQDRDVIPYGKDIKDNKYYILNAQGELCPAGVVGQLYMLGINLANGYLVDGKITQTDFVWLSFPNGEKHRAFRMSDKGFLREDGNIIFAGRDEGYLKIRGVRMAASEIENALSKHQDITDCVVTMCTNPMYDGNELVAIYTVMAQAEQSLTPSILRKFLQQYIPDSHIPSRWLLLSKFPITPNGKINRKELKKIAQERLYQVQTSSIQQHSQIAEQSLEKDVIEHLRHSLNEHHIVDLFVGTEILAVGITSRHLNHLARHFSQQLNTPIDFMGLARCKTIGDIVKSINFQINQK